MSTLFNVSVLVGLLAALLVVLEQILPVNDSQRPLDVTDLPEKLRTWHARGRMVEVAGHNVFARVEGQGAETLLLVHGFPTSSYDYHRALEHLTKDFRVVMFDHLGFGFSDKPNKTYIYSLADQAEIALGLWRALNITSGHIVAHDMGDSVVTEILSRRDRRVLPDHFNNFFKSVTFTNGGMRISLSSLRLSQYLLPLPKLGAFLTSLMKKLPASWANAMREKQITSVWSPTYADQDQMLRDVEDISLINRVNGGMDIMHKTISYLSDRRRFEPRWLDALARLDIPCMLLWGDSDSVAPMDIPKSLGADYVNKEMFTGKIIKGTGHFLMLEQPQVWAETIKNFVIGIKS